jgi:hypothetical protein
MTPATKLLVACLALLERRGRQIGRSIANAIDLHRNPSESRPTFARPGLNSSRSGNGGLARFTPMIEFSLVIDLAVVSGIPVGDCYLAA